MNLEGFAGAGTESILILMAAAAAFVNVIMIYRVMIERGCKVWIQGYGVTFSVKMMRLSRLSQQFGCPGLVCGLEISQ